MGNCLSNKPHGKTKYYDNIIKQSYYNTLNKGYIVLLGESGCGKTCLIKQLKIIYNSNNDYNVYKDNIYKNIIDIMINILNELDNCNIYLNDKDNIKETLNNCLNTNPLLFSSVSDIISDLWKLDIIKNTFNSIYDYHIWTSAYYLMNNLDNYCDNNYEFIDNDSIICFNKTENTYYEDIEMGNTEIRFIDTSGSQYNQLNKNILQQFEDCNFIYIISLSEYDLFDKNTNENRLLLALKHYEQFINNLPETIMGIVLFFNKIDIFADKINNGIDFRICFPSYDGELSCNSILEFIRTQFVNLTPNLKIYSHCTCIIDTQNINAIMYCVKSIYLIIISIIIKNIY